MNTNRTTPSSISPTALREGDEVLFNNKWCRVVGAYMLPTGALAVNYVSGKGETQTFFCGREIMVDVRFCNNPGKVFFTRVTIKHGTQMEAGSFVVESTDGQRAVFTDLKWAALAFKALTGQTHNGDLPSLGLLVA